MNVSSKSTIQRVQSTRLRRALSVSAAALSLSLAAQAPAREPPALAASNDDAFVTGASFAPQDCPSARTVQRGGVSLSQATAIAQSRVPGRVVKAETVMSGDRVIHEIRILSDDGRVRTVRIDARTGEFL
jgi:uncharacterized membrane protein YkoI